MSKKNNTHTPLLSLSMIIKNEEKFLEGCLESVRGLVDEIVIVDTGSTDRSREIAERFGAKVFEFEWIGDFAAARNFSLQQCSSDWILYLDADERFSANQERELRKLISASHVSAYNVIIENPHSLKQGTSNQENSYPRLFRRLAGVQFEGKVHEQLFPSLLRQQLVVKQSSLVIHHLGYDQGYDVVKQKAERNLQLLRNQLAEHPADAYAQFQIGNSLVVLQRCDEAEPELLLAVQNPNLDRSNRASCFNLLAEVEVKRKNFTRAVEHCLQSLEVAPKQLMAHWFLSLLYFDLKRFEGAIAALKKIEQLIQLPSSQRSNQIASDLDVKKSDLHTRFGLTYEASGRFIEAMNSYARVLELAPQSEEATQGFLRCVERVEDPRVAIEKLTSLVKKIPQRTEFFFPLAYHHRKLNDIRSAVKFIEQTLIVQPNNAQAYAFAARWKAEAGDMIGAEKILTEATSRKLSAFELHKIAMELALKQGNVDSAFYQLDLMTKTTTADLSPLKKRLATLAGKISASPIS